MILSTFFPFHEKLRPHVGASAYAVRAAGQQTIISNKILKNATTPTTTAAGSGKNRPFENGRELAICLTPRNHMHLSPKYLSAIADFFSRGLCFLNAAEVFCAPPSRLIVLE